MPNATGSSPKPLARIPDFFAFYRSMQAFEAGLRANDPRLVLRPDSDFFKYFANPSGKETP
jgi:membrane protease subunit HflC